MKIERIPPMNKSKQKDRADDWQHWRKNKRKRGAKGLSNKIKAEYEQIHGRKP